MNGKQFTIRHSRYTKPERLKDCEFKSRLTKKVVSQRPIAYPCLIPPTHNYLYCYKYLLTQSCFCKRVSHKLLATWQLKLNREKLTLVSSPKPTLIK